MSLSLKNLREIRLTSVLVHDYFCEHGKSCACAIALRPRRRVPAVVSVAPGETVYGLSPAILALPEVERAIRRGRVRLERSA